jgi:hypothetical protein
MRSVNDLKDDELSAWRVALQIDAAKPSVVLGAVIRIATFGNIQLCAPWQRFALQLDRKMLRRMQCLLATPPSGVLDPQVAALKEDLTQGLGVFLATDRSTFGGRCSIGAMPDLPYVAWFLDFAISRHGAEFAARIAGLFPSVRRAFVVDPAVWLLLVLDREDALLLRDALVIDSPSEVALERKSRYLERLTEAIEDISDMPKAAD